MQKDRACAFAPSPTLPRKRGRERTEFASLIEDVDGGDGTSPRYGLNSARMRLQPSAGGVAGSGAGSTSASPLGPGSSGACTSGITAGATAVISRARGARDSSAVAAAIARRALRPPAEKGSG